MDLVGRKAKAMVRNKRERKLRLATWNFSGLCSDRKQKEIGELLAKHNLDVVAGQESWEKEETRIDVEGYKWFGKPRIKQNSPRGEGGVGFLVRECLVNEVEAIIVFIYFFSLTLFCILIIFLIFFSLHINFYDIIL